MGRCDWLQVAMKPEVMSWEPYLHPTVVVVDCRCQTAITICVSIEQSAGRQTLSGSIRKPYQRSLMGRVSILQITLMPKA